MIVQGCLSIILVREVKQVGITSKFKVQMLKAGAEYLVLNSPNSKPKNSSCRVGMTKYYDSSNHHEHRWPGELPSGRYTIGNN